MITKSTTCEKLDNRELVCIFVGYSGMHRKSAFYFVNLETNQMVHSRDIHWLNKTWEDWHDIKQQHIIQMRNDESDSNEEEVIQSNEIESENVLNEGTN